MGTIKGQEDDVARSKIMVPVLVSVTFASPKFRLDLKAQVQQQVERSALESEPVKKLLEKEEVKKFEQSTKDLLKKRP